MKRRLFTSRLSLLALLPLTTLRTAAHAKDKDKSTTSKTPTKETADEHHQAAMQRYEQFTTGPKVTIGLLIYPGMFLQDLVGPLTVFEALMNKEIHLLWKTLDPVGNEDPKTPALIPVKPTTTFEQCPEHLDVLFVPGGVPGTFTMMEDPVVMAFLAKQGKTAKFVTSVCTGSLILGAAGLLKGYKATSYWATREVLKEFGAIPVHQRIVTDRNRITGGGVTAGIDFGLYIASKLRSKSYAQAIQLYLEYDPQPPFQSGSPEKAPAAVRQFLTDMFAGTVDTARTLAKKIISQTQKP